MQTLTEKGNDLEIACDCLIEDNDQLRKKLNIYALETINSYPIPFELLDSSAIHQARIQLRCVDDENLEPFECMSQYVNGHVTYWSRKGNKHACIFCVQEGKVCMRWLVGNAFVMLSLVSGKEGLVGPVALEY
jgi:hypothetical protein